MLLASVLMRAEGVVGTRGQLADAASTIAPVDSVSPDPAGSNGVGRRRPSASRPVWPRLHRSVAWLLRRRRAHGDARHGRSPLRSRRRRLRPLWGDVLRTWSRDDPALGGRKVPLSVPLVLRCALRPMPQAGRRARLSLAASVRWQQLGEWQWQHKKIRVHNH